MNLSPTHRLLFHSDPANPAMPNRYKYRVLAQTAQVSSALTLTGADGMGSGSTAVAVQDVTNNIKARKLGLYPTGASSGG